jgi:hypothetical protein
VFGHGWQMYGVLGHGWQGGGADPVDLLGLEVARAVRVPQREQRLPGGGRGRGGER